MNDSRERAEELYALAARLGLQVKDLELYDRALTHASSAPEDASVVSDYEALEFLGDAVLGLAVSHHLFVSLPDRTPGEYSRMRASLVNRKVVAKVGRELEIAPFIRLGKGEELSGGRQRTSLVADCMEALIGAIYLDSGWPAAQHFVERVFAEHLRQVHRIERVWDYKSRLQHFCQAEHAALPVFKVVRSEGPDHRKEFEMEVCVNERALGRGRGSTKKEAEQHAAREALEHLGQELG